MLEPDLDFFRFPKHKTGWGVRYPGQGIFTPTIYHRLSDKALERNSLFLEVYLTEITLFISKVIMKKDKFYFENSGGGKIPRVRVKIPRENLPPGGQAAHGYLPPRREGVSCPGVEINRYTGMIIVIENSPSDIISCTLITL